LAREPSKIKGKLGNYHVNSCEIGMTRLTLYNEEDKSFDQFMKEERH